MKKVSNMLSLLICVCFCMYLSCVFVGCDSKSQIQELKYNVPDVYDIIESGNVAQNEKYSLVWDSEYGCVSLLDKESGHSWSTIPNGANDNGVDDFGFKILAAPKVNSSLIIQTINPTTQTQEISFSYSAVQEGSMDCELTENGIRVTYYFTDVEIAIPVEYTLRETGLSVSIDPTKIMQGETKLYTVSMLPYLCSVKNMENIGYLFTPSGCGALIYPKKLSSSGISYSEPFYGDDATIQVYDKITNKENLLLPVYGANNGNTGTLVIIEGGAESAKLEGTIAASEDVYSNLSSVFYVRGYDNRTVVSGVSAKELVTLYSDTLIQEKISIGVYPLTEGEADYNGMAKTYRDYLTKVDGLSDGNASESAVHLKFIGGTLVKKSFLGIPYTSLYPLTTIEQTKNIVSEISQNISSKVSVELTGYGQSGIVPKKLSGNYKIASKLGNTSQLKGLQQHCIGSDNSFYFDFDMISIGKSANGWSYFSDIAKGPTGLKSYQYDYLLTTRSRTSPFGKYGLISRGLITKSAEKLIKNINEWELSGVGISTLSSVSYSDYDDIKYYMKGNMSNDVSDAIEILKDNGSHAILANAANGYAACMADEITDVPLQSDANDAYDAEIPFYQMVFRGYKSLTSSPINMSGDYQENLLRAIESGCGISWTLINNYDTSLISSANYLNQSLYADIKDNIIDSAKRTEGVYEAIGSSKIQKFEILSESVRKTSYENGVVIYTNHGDDSVVVDHNKIEAKAFLVKEGVY